MGMDHHVRRADDRHMLGRQMRAPAEQQNVAG
jgi:hypothetical protein